jgi:UDP-N-acetylmuramoyl-tripeptide--D-alanyl-D-alanine ligase
LRLPVYIILQATLGSLYDAEQSVEDVRVVTDTRELEPGDAFVALHGERFDGHDFVKEAQHRGASLVIVDRREARIDGVATIIVENTLTAYMAIAAAARDRFRGQVIGLTGSAGKTTTKSLLAQLLAASGSRFLASPANENNEIGVSKLLLAAEPSAHDILVVEMGARHYGDIAKLVRIAKPELGVLTNIGEAHLEIMGTRERLEETKWGLFSQGARAILNAADVASLARSSRLSEPPHWFLERAEGEQVDAPGRTTAVIGASQLVDIDVGGTHRYTIDVRLPGAHNRANLAAAIAAAIELGVPIDAIVTAIPNLVLPPGRFESIRLPGGVRLIYDAYNANASGTLAALEAFSMEDGERRIAVIASMAELGDESEALHERVGASAAAKVDVLLVGGDFAESLASGATRAGLSADRLVRFASNDEAATWLRDSTRSGDVVLLKGSRKYRLEEIVEDLRS